MKLSVVFFVVLVASACANDKEEAHKKRKQETMKKCIKEAGTTLEELEICNKEKKQCPKMDCYESCNMREDGFINKDGIVNTRKVEQFALSLHQYGHPKTAKAVKKCFLSPMKKLKFCDVAPTLLGCMVKEPHD